LGKGKEIELSHGAEVILKKKIAGKEKIAYVYEEWTNGEEPETTEMQRLYRVGDILGQGSFAKVYTGEDRNTGRKVAVKVIEKNKIQLIQSTRNCDLMDEVTLNNNNSKF